MLSNLELAGSSTVGVTIERIHLQVAIQWLTNTIANKPYVALGLILGRDADITNNTPSFAAEPELDWLLATILYPRTSPTLNAQDVYTFDLRAKRRLREMGDRLVFNAYNPNANQISVQASARVLVRLP